MRNYEKVQELFSVVRQLAEENYTEWKISDESGLKYKKEQKICASRKN